MESAELLSRLTSALSGKPDIVPEGWLTAKQLSARLGRSDSHGRRLIAIGVANGILDMKRFRIKFDGMVRLVPHYAEKKT